MKFNFFGMSFGKPADDHGPFELERDRITATPPLCVRVEGGMEIVSALAAQIPDIVDDLTKAEQLSFEAFCEDPEGLSAWIFHGDISVMITVARRDGDVRSYVSAGLDEPQHEIDLDLPELALHRVLFGYRQDNPLVLLESVLVHIRALSGSAHSIAKQDSVKSALAEICHLSDAFHNLPSAVRGSTVMSDDEWADIDNVIRRKFQGRRNGYLH